MAQTPPAAGAARPAAPVESWQFGVVLDAAHLSQALELGSRDKGLQLGHSDLSASGPLGRHLQAQFTAVVATHEGRLERAVEEAWVQTRSLPGGLSLRAGRFASQVGYLNAQHPHADDFAERPLLYRAFLGGHWVDDGLRLNLTLPTGVYAQLGAEVMRGRKLVPGAAGPAGAAGAFTLAAKVGADIGRSHSWQLGLSYVNNRRTAMPHGHHEEEEEEAHEGSHGHGAAFGGRHLWLVDATWKWAPGGNNREQQLRVTLEAARVSGTSPEASQALRHEALGLAAVWRLHPNWEVGGRIDRLRVAVPHEGLVERGRLAEHTLMVAWKPSHLQTVRLQFARQGSAEGFAEPARRAVALQVVLGWGAHGAHSY